jgi:hypothetical protein
VNTFGLNAILKNLSEALKIRENTSYSRLLENLLDLPNGPIKRSIVANAVTKQENNTTKQNIIKKHYSRLQKSKMRARGGKFGDVWVVKQYRCRPSGGGLSPSQALK